MARSADWREGEALTVLHVIPTLGHGGTEVACRGLISQLKLVGVTSAVAGLCNASGSIRQELAAASGRPVTLLRPGRLRRMRHFFRLCRQRRPQSVVFHFFTIDHAALALAARLARTRVLLAAAGNPAPPPHARSAGKWRLVLALSRMARCPVVSASHWIDSSLARLGGLPAGSSVVHNACDVIGISQRASEARRRRQDGAFVIGMVARLDPIKDHATLLAALAQLVEAFPEVPVELRLVGAGPLRPMLASATAAIGIAGQVRFLGNRDDIPEQLGQLDLFVLSTTEEEGFGIALIEALAAAVPVIATDVPACREVLQDGALGALVAPHDPTALADAMAAHLRRWQAGVPAELPDPVAVARAYDLPRMADAYLRLLRLETKP